MAAEVRRLGRLRTVGRYAAGLVHDFNNALNGVVAYLDRQSYADRSATGHEIIEHVETSLARGTQLLNFVTAHIVANPRDREVIEVGQLRDDAAQLIGTHARRRDTTLDVFGECSTRVRVVRTEALELLLQYAGHAVSTVGPSRRVKLEAATLDLEGRVFGAVVIELDGDPDADRGVRSVIDSPEDGFVSAEPDARSLVGGLLRLHLSGGVARYSNDEGLRRFAFGFPSVRSAGSS
jgi:hypothetical protein